MKSIQTLLGLVLLCPIFAAAQSQTTKKVHKLQAGTFVEMHKEFQKNPMFSTKNISGVSLGVAGRYQLSNTFTVASGIGASIAAYKYEYGPFDYYRHFEGPIEKEAGRTTQYTLRLPVTLQTNIYKRKLFLSTGIELFKDLYSRTNATFTEMSTHKTREASYSYKGGIVDAQLIAGLGWNFNAFHGNVFSLEANVKMYILGGYSPASRSDIYSPALRLNWYFIK